MKRTIDDNILAKYFDHTATAAELEIINSWLEADQKNEVLLKQYHQIWTASNAEVKNFEPNVKAAWEQIEPKLLVRKKQPNYLRIAAVAVGVLLVSTYLILTNNRPTEYLSFKSEAETQIKTLSDGSTITLNSFSLLEYPEEFESGERRIKLIGEAFFDIAKNPDKPFIIEANGTEIKVLGTSFNVTARDENVKVSVNSGRVEFKKTAKKKVVLEKGDEAIYESKKDTITAAAIFDRNIFAYKTKVFEFKNTKIEEVVNTLNKGYKSDIKLEGSNWENYALTTKFENENLFEALGIIAETLDLKVKSKDKSYILVKNTIPE
ncbi:FecR domain-containing protein [uncultured Arcticibacterium sp.]|uniref:FecR family protein n=1 Tax=uncultured Arcticibacterium sp. TaxID=2173042 RepID=UPI0030FAF092